MEKRVLYFDNNATTRLDPQVVEAMMPYLTEFYGNPSSIHSFGGQVGEALKQARTSVAKLIGAEHDYEIVFMGTGTESDNTAILGTLAYHKDKKHIVTSKVEHPAVLSLYKKLERDGYTTTYVPVDDEGNLDMHALKEAITEDTAIVSIMFANNETGVIFPVEEVGKICNDRGVVYHIDAVQAAGKVPIDVEKIGCDLLTISGHKIHAPKGVGVLYVRRGTRIRPILYGGHQERSRRPGTENVPGIVALGKAADLAVEQVKNEEDIRSLRDKFEKAILEACPNAHVNGSTVNRVPNTTNIGFDYIEGESILLYLDEKGICASSGSACSSGSLEPSHVLRAMGVPFIRAHGAIRFSFSRFTTEEEIDYAIKVIPEVVTRLLEISPYWDSEKNEPLPVNLDPTSCEIPKQ